MHPSCSMATKFSTCRSQRVTNRRELCSQAKNPFDDPAPLVASERPAVLRRAHAVVPMRGDKLYPKARPQGCVQAVTVVRPIPNQARRVGRDETGPRAWRRRAELHVVKQRPRARREEDCGGRRLP